jgi:predicted transglutaminase-like cysteine proteinase
MKIFGKYIGLAAQPLIQLKFINAMGDPVDTALPNSLSAINAHVNRSIRYRKDIADEWHSPQDTLRTKAGDCEDIVLLKRAMLLAKGWPAENLIMLIARDVLLRQDHAVLLVLDGQKIWMLDNLHDNVVDALQPNGYLNPIVALSSESAWVFGQQKSTQTQP